MEKAKSEAVSEELLAKSQTRSLDELRERGRAEVKVIRASDVTSMISETVNRVLRDTKLLSDEDIELLVQSGTKEFKRVFRERQLERQRVEEKFREVQDDLHAARTRIQELEAQLEGSGERRAGVPADTQADLMMRMMTEMAEMKVNLAQAQTVAAPAAGQPAPSAGADIGGALDAITSKLNDRLEQFGKKMGISSAVEAQNVNYESLFNDDSDANIESNMGDVEVKQKSGGGIAGNLARLKKLKGGG